MINQPPVVRVSRAPQAELAPDEWPRTVPAVEHVLEEGLDLPHGVTFLVGDLTIQRGVGAARWGFFLRAETMHGWYTFIEAQDGRDPDYHAMSHGESFLAVLRQTFDSPGFYCLDEPEAALSFASTLTLMHVLHRIAQAGGQVLCATHSPVLAALPGARLLEVGAWGLRESTWEQLELVQHWRGYLAAPERYLRHLLDDD